MYGIWRSPVARFVRDEEVASSNLAIPTSILWVYSWWVYRWWLRDVMIKFDISNGFLPISNNFLPVYWYSPLTICEYYLRKFIEFTILIVQKISWNSNSWFALLPDTYIIQRATVLLSMYGGVSTWRKKAARQRRSKLTLISKPNKKCQTPYDQLTLWYCATNMRISLQIGMIYARLLCI